MVDPGVSPCDGSGGPRVQASVKAGDVHRHPDAEPVALGAPRAALAPWHGLSPSWCVPGVGTAAPGAVGARDRGVPRQWGGSEHPSPKPLRSLSRCVSRWPAAGISQAGSHGTRWHPSQCPPGAAPAASPGSGASLCLGAGGSGIDFPQKQDTAGEPAGLLPLPGKRSWGWGWERAGSWLCQPRGSLLWGRLDFGMGRASAVGVR